MFTITLKKGKEEAVRRFHPWIFSGALHPLPEGITEGALVTVCSYKKEVLGTGYYAPNNIAVRMLSFEDVAINNAFWAGKFRSAFQVRTLLGLTDSAATNCYRLIHGEGDGIPGLIVDFYNGTAVVQCHTVGIHLQMDAIKDALLVVYGSRLKAVFDKSKETLPHPYVAGIENKYWYKADADGTDQSGNETSEYGHRFSIDWETGQKTGFFLDQRENRALLTKYCNGKRVLNTFCYTGGFSVYALAAGASVVHSVDVSGKAMDLTDINIGLNSPFAGTHESVKADVLSFFQQSDLQYDIVIVDPPAYAKNISKRHNAVQGYRRLNAAALEHVTPGGLLFTFSCSQVVDRELFYNTIVAAALDSGRNIRVLQHLSQGPDHPVNIYHPEGSYLKGLVLYVE